MTYNFADTNRSFVRKVKEVQWGSTPTSGNTRVMSITSHNLTTKKNTVVSNTIRADRLVQDVILTEMMSDGGINFEFSAGAIDDELEAFVLGQWTRPMTLDFVTGVQIAWTGASTITITNAKDYSKVFTAGRRIKVTDFITPSNNGFFSISTITFASGVTTITVSASSGTAEAGNIATRLEDANDVIILADTAMQADATGGGFKHTGAFSSAIAAGQIVAGQRIHVEGLGYEVGSIAFAAVCVALTSVTVSDGLANYTFVAGTDFAVGATAANSATNLAKAINTSRVLGLGSITAPTASVNCYATASGSSVSIKNLNGTGGSLSKFEPSSGTNLTVTAFSGGDATQHGLYTVVSVTADEVFTSPVPTVNLNAGSLPVTIRGSMLRNPLATNIVPQSFSLEAGYQDAGKYVISDGQRVQDFSLNINAGQIVTGSLNYMGRATTVQTADTLGNAPYVAQDVQGTEIMNATVDVGQLQQNGSTLSTAIKEIKIDGKAQLRNQMAVGSKFPVGIGTGRFELSGSFNAYFQDFTQFNHFLNHDTVSLSFYLQDTKGLTYFWTIPALKLKADPIHSKGIDQDVMEEITWEALRDPVTQTEIQIDRFSSLLAV